ncbi:hypothetical protein K402DRAFT_194446 [Aulographum hederae CBS 113979]|uniref:Uncharacterized protein n=1 Tax=Aulographum hederae CBS 113979 TaxID=1176131 RepID=A0A6G1GP37_9PEZI|nr:hypothetical protein K402DRAFT_194446 [Aulographum hederae CBS 113979]
MPSLSRLSFISSKDLFSLSYSYTLISTGNRWSERAWAQRNQKPGEENPFSSLTRIILKALRVTLIPIAAVLELADVVFTLNLLCISHRLGRISFIRFY